MKGVIGQLGRSQAAQTMQAIQAKLPKTLQSEDRRMPVPHGFRGAFETWALKCTHFREAIIRACLAHCDLFGSKDERERALSRQTGTYFHDEFEIERAILMIMWQEYVTTGRVSKQWNSYLTPLGRGEPSAELIKLNERRRIVG